MTTGTERFIVPKITRTHALCLGRGVKLASKRPAYSSPRQPVTQKPPSCCSPPSGDSQLEQAPAPKLAASSTSKGRNEQKSAPSIYPSNLVALKGGTFRMGSDADEGEPSDGEAPSRLVTIQPFLMQASTVSNQQFAEFVKATDYVTLAQEHGHSFVFAGLLPHDFPHTRGVADAPWWREVPGANWQHPEGRGSTIAQRGLHPVVHVSWFDAKAYCDWAGLRLPTEAEWEYAARGGLVDQRYAWGDELSPQGTLQCNIWQGRFPQHNTLEDGYYGTAPVDAFAPNAYGLFNVCGNVWEWSADWFHNNFSDQALVDPKGPPQGVKRVLRGGSYLCHDSYCNRYRVAARSSNQATASTGHMGFRCAADLPIKQG